MKACNIVNYLFALSILLSACTKDVLDGGSTVPSVLGDLESTSYMLPEASENPYLFRMHWTKTKFFAEEGKSQYVADIQYEIEADLSQNEFAQPTVLHRTTGLYFDVYAEALRTLYQQYGNANAAEEPIVVSIRVKATGNGIVIYSDPVLINVLPYVPVPVFLVVPSTLEALPQSAYTLSKPSNAAQVLFSIDWSETTFFLNDVPTVINPVNYTLQIDRSGNNFATPVTLAQTTESTVDIGTVALNEILLTELGAMVGTPIAVEMRLQVNYGQQNQVGQVMSSNVLHVTLTPYSEINPLQPVYIIGDLNGWNNNNTDGMYPMFKNSMANIDFIYTYTGFIPGNCNFKFLPKESLGSYKAYSKVDNSEGRLEYVETGGGAIYNADAGYKTITIDLKNMTYSMQDYNASSATVYDQLSLTGSFNGWNPTATQMNRFSTDNKHIWWRDLTLANPPEGETWPAKFTGNSSFDHRWAPASPEDVTFGKAIYLKSPDDNIVIREGGNYRVIFNDITGHYLILKKNNL